MQNEIWLDVPGFPGYQVSNAGRVKSFRFGERILKQCNDGYGYPKVRLWRDATGMTVPDLLGKLAEIAEKKVKNMEAEIKASAYRHEVEKNLNKQIRYWREIMDACKGWKIEEIEIE